MSTPQRVLVIGGGLAGLATAYRFEQRFPEAKVTVLEKEAGVGKHQSGHNSGVLHAGLYYKPGSIKARMAVCGIRQMVEFCRENGIPHEVCGKLVVAANEEELPRLQNLFERGQANGLKGLKLLGAEEMREIEPHVGGIAALRVPEEGIVDYPKVCETLTARIHGRVITSAEVRGLRQVSGGWVAVSAAGDFETDLLINCAGLHCDRVAQMAGLRRDVRIVPFRGEYYKIKPERQFLVRNLIYPVPDPKFPFLGVHFTRLIPYRADHKSPLCGSAAACKGHRTLAKAAGTAGQRPMRRQHTRPSPIPQRREGTQDVECRTSESRGSHSRPQPRRMKHAGPGPQGPANSRP